MRPNLSRFGEIFYFATKHLLRSVRAFKLLKKHCYERFFSFMHIDKRLCIIFSWNSPDYGRPKTVENKGSNVLHDRINITFSDWVIVENIISGNVIINRGWRVARRRPGSMGFNII